MELNKEFIAKFNPYDLEIILRGLSTLAIRNAFNIPSFLAFDVF